MKKYFLYFVLLCCCILIFNSCKKSTTNPADTPGISFKVDGNAETMTAFQATNYTSVVVPQITIVGTFQTETLSLVIRNPKVGTFSVTDNIVMSYSTDITDDSFYFGGSAGASSSFSPTGSITITSLSTTSVAGTFQFNCINKLNATPSVKNITEGKFKCDVVQQ